MKAVGQFFDTIVVFEDSNIGKETFVHEHGPGHGR